MNTACGPLIQVDVVALNVLLRSRKRPVVIGNGSRAVLYAQNQFGVRQLGQSKRKIKAQVKENLGATLMGNLMLALLANRPPWRRRHVRF
jgi:hypothetical protein